MLNDETIATPETICSYLNRMATDEEEFVILSNYDTGIFLQSCFDEEEMFFFLEYNPDDGKIYRTTTDRFDLIIDSMLKFYNSDYSFLNNFYWEPQEL